MIRPQRILVLGTSTGRGDLPPLLAVASGLVDRGHDVHFIGDRALANLTQGTRLAVNPVPQGMEAAEYRAHQRRIIASSPDSSSQRWFAFDWAEDVFLNIREKIETFRPEAIVCNLFTLILGTIVRKKVGVPLCFINSTFCFGPGSRRTIEEDFAPGDTPMVQSVIPLLDQIDLALHGTDAVFDPPPSPAPSHHRWVGPLLWEPAIECPSYLKERGHAWALVTLSTNRQTDEAALARTALNVLESFPLRVVLTLGDPGAQAELDPVPANARIESFVPHSEVLKRAALSISHAGHGIVSKSLYYGVPMVLVPWGRDQPGVAARAEALGLAKVVPREELSAEKLRKAILEVLSDNRYSQAARVSARRLQAQDPVALACAHVEGLQDNTSTPHR